MATRPSKTTRKPRARRPGRPRADEANQRERLLDAAVECFAVDGIAATSLRSIAVKAGVTPALVHYYFGSKERLLETFFGERIAPALGLMRESLLAAGTEPRALVTAFVHGLYDVVARYPWWPALWVREVLGEGGALRGFFLEVIAPQVPRAIAETLAGAQRRGELSADLDPRLLVVSLIGLTMFPLAAESIWRRVFAADDVDRAALLRHTLALLDHGLGGSHAS